MSKEIKFLLFADFHYKEGMYLSPVSDVEKMMKCAHEAAADDNDCTTDVGCTGCEAIVVAAKSHNFSGEYKSDAEGHWYVCQNTDCTVADTKAEHTPADDDNNCATEVKCTVCGFVTTTAKTHNFSGEWKKDAEGHWYACQNANCTVEQETKTEHTSSGSPTETTAETCTVCNFIINHEAIKWMI